MNVDLGKYAIWVLTAYGATVLLLVLLVGFYLWLNMRSKVDLKDAEDAKDA